MTPIWWVAIVAMVSSSIVTPIVMLLIAREQAKALKVIHVLVNSNLTASKTSEYGAMMSNLILLRDVIWRDKKGGANVNPEYISDLAATEKRVADLKLELADRDVQNKNADQELKSQAAYASRTPNKKVSQ